MRLIVLTIVTVVEGAVPAGKEAELEQAFKEAKQQAAPQGLLTSTLLRNVNQPQIYRIQTVWLSKEVLEKMRQTTATPKAFELFQKVGAKAQLQVYEEVDSIP